MKLSFVTIAAMFITMISMSSFANSQITIESDQLRVGAKYYLRYDQISESKAAQAGVAVPGVPDDEGYCELMYMTDHLYLRKGEAAEVVGSKSWTRKVYSYRQQKVIEVQDTYSVVRLADSSEFLVGCSIDRSASETVGYVPATNPVSRAYLTILGLIVK